MAAKRWGEVLYRLDAWSYKHPWPWALIVLAFNVFVVLQVWGGHPSRSGVSMSVVLYVTQMLVFIFQLEQRKPPEKRKELRLPQIWKK